MKTTVHPNPLVGSIVITCVALAAAFVIAGTARSEALQLAMLEVTSRPNVTESLPEATPPASTTFMAVGDIMLSRTVADKMVRHGFGYPYSKMLPELQSAGFVFGNLETPITDGPRIEAGQMVFRADPGVESALKNANVQVVSLANNHTPNFGQVGLLDTFRYLEQAGIAYTGAGANATEARKAAFITSRGISIAFLAYNDTDVVPDTYAAGDTRPGTVFMEIEPMKADVVVAKQQADIVVVSMHSGNEYAATPNDRQTSFARAAIDAGAEIVIGHHPHVVQTIEEYRGKLIIYSLGNFIFDQMWSMETRQGMAAMISVTEQKVTSVDFIPILIDGYCQPRTTDSTEGEQILRRLGTAVSLDDGFRWRSID